LPDELVICISGLVINILIHWSKVNLCLTNAHQNSLFIFAIMKAICVFCGANFNGDPALKQAVELLAEVMVSKHITLIYGGGNVGIMGLLADAVMARGGEVVGVIPQFLMDKEVGHTGITKLHIVDNMHQRKQMMNDLCDGIIMLPGGFGTLEEFFEVLTWLQLGLHS
jgi:uncharacterized protein (TIGR00730 family)